MNFDAVICFEIHAELKTKTKLFCQCAIDSGASSNHQICPVCTGQPGTLPVLNKKAVEYCIRAGLALNCEINKQAGFARKNYFYPDLPKGYQISQYDQPLCKNGYLEITGDDGRPYKVGINRIHLEEDAGKLLHFSSADDSPNYSLVDYNRSGVPLIEIVSDHTRNHIRSLKEAKIYLESVRQILQYVDVSDCIIEQGQFRCDVNVSLRRKGEKDFGDRVEIKNMVSFKFIQEALEYEIRRQSEILESGGLVSQETKLFDENKGVTIPMRSKEDAPDYRYFPDPDLVDLECDQTFIQAIRQGISELPSERMARFATDYNLSKKDTLLLIKDRKVSDYFEHCSSTCHDRKKLVIWITNELFRLLNDAYCPIERCPVDAKDFARLINLISEGDITEKIGKTVLDVMFKTSQDPDSIIRERDLKPIQSTHILEDLIKEVLAENSETVSMIKQDNKQPINFLVGQVMKKTKGKADARKINRMLSERLL